MRERQRERERESNPSLWKSLDKTRIAAFIRSLWLDQMESDILENEQIDEILKHNA